MRHASDNRMAMDGVNQPRSREALAAQRDARMRSARRISGWAAGIAVVLVGGFAGLAANARPGHHIQKSASSSASTPAPQPAAPRPDQSGGTDPGALAPPDQPPAATEAPPVAQSGGS